LHGERSQVFASLSLGEQFTPLPAGHSCTVSRHQANITTAQEAKHGATEGQIICEQRFYYGQWKIPALQLIKYFQFE